MDRGNLHNAAAAQTDQHLVNLIHECAKGNQSALEQLYKATSAHVFAVLKRFLRIDALAEEALQETYIKVWNNAHQYSSSKSAPRTWVTSIGRNQAIDTLRRRKSREDIELNLDSSTMETLPAKHAPMEMQTENNQLLNNCLDALAAPARECVVRAYCEGFSAEELSEQLNRPIGTIKSWIRRSLISLKECLNGYA